jgi:hypothetical protein
MTKRIDDLVNMLQDYQVAHSLVKKVGKKGYFAGLSISSDEDDDYECITISNKTAKDIIERLIFDLEIELESEGVKV